MTADDPWASSWTSPELTPWQAYERTLTAAGYGPEDRRRYIAESGQDPEYAACVWDEQILSAAEAAGILPEPPDVEPPLGEQVRDWCRRFAIRQFDAAHGNPAPWDLTKQDTHSINVLAERLIARHGEALAAYLQANPAAPTVTDDYERGIFALLADPQTQETDK